MGASSLVRSWLAELWTDHLGVHDPGEGRTARPASFATFATAVAFGCQFDHTAPPSGRDHVSDLAVDAIASWVGEGLPPVRDLFNKPTILNMIVRMVVASNGSQFGSGAAAQSRPTHARPGAPRSHANAQGLFAEMRWRGCCLLYTSPSPQTPEHLVCRLL